MKRTKTPKRDKHLKPAKAPLSGIFKFLIIVVVIGFVVAVGVLIQERLRFSNMVLSVTNHRQATAAFENLARLFESYNKSNTTELLSLFYSVLTTIAFSYGIIIFNNVRTEAKISEKAVDDVNKKVDAAEDKMAAQTLFMRLGTWLNTALCIAIKLCAAPTDPDDWSDLGSLKEHLEQCDKRIKVHGETVIDSSFSYSLLTTLDLLIDSIQTISNKAEAVEGGISNENKEGIDVSNRICNKYRDILRTLKTTTQ